MVNVEVQDGRTLPAADGELAGATRRVLNAGSGPQSARSLHPAFALDGWQETRIDIDAANRPDVIGSITDMSTAFPPESFDAVWSSHVLEHLFAHQVPPALLEFKRVLKPAGFALISSPDLEAIASLILEKGLEHVAYVSPAGPITALDMLYGHTASVARGFVFMAHKSGFTSALLGHRLLHAGFTTVLVKRDRFDVWALALREEADKAAIQQQLGTVGLDMFDEAA